MISLTLMISFCIHNIVYQGKFVFSYFTFLNMLDKFKGSFDFRDGYVLSNIPYYTSFMNFSLFFQIYNYFNFAVFFFWYIINLELSRVCIIINM
ncbi:unnamed protein product, partial [Vitis vinifera]